MNIGQFELYRDYHQKIYETMYDLIYAHQLLDRIIECRNVAVTTPTQQKELQRLPDEIEKLQNKLKKSGDNLEKKVGETTEEPAEPPKEERDENNGKSIGPENVTVTIVGDKVEKDDEGKEESAEGKEGEGTIV